MRNLVGQQIGPYKMEELLGSGGMADVYRAHQANLDRYVAIKVLKTSLADDPEFISRFSREAMAAGSLRHPNILRIYDAGTFEGWHYIVMDYVTGGTLAQYADKTPLSIDDAAQLVIQIADALDYAHSRPRPIIHRDLKPSNILMDEGRPLLSDFGIAYMVSTEQRLTQTGSSLGTPEYMSPEQSEGLPVDGRTDIYSLGVILYQLVAGRVPFQAGTPIATMHQVVYSPPPPPRQFKSNVPEWIESVILRALAKRPIDRFSTAKEMANALREHRIVAVPAQSITESADRTVVSHQKRAAASTAGAAGAATTERRGAGRGVIVAMLSIAILAVLGSAAYLAMPSLRGGSAAGQPVAQVPATPTVQATALPTFTPASPAAPALAGPTPAQPVAVEPTSAPVDKATPGPTPSSTPLPTETAAPTGTSPANTRAAPTSAPTATIAPTSAPTSAPTAATLAAASAPAGTAAPTSPPANAGPASKPGTVLDFERFGTWQRGLEPYGTLTQSTEQAHSGKSSAKLAYDFPAVDNEYVVFDNKPATAIPGKPAALTAWVYGDGSGHFLNAWVKDSAGQVRQFTFGRISHQGWRQLTAALDTSAPWPQTHIDGPDNPQLAYPLSLQALVLDAVPHGKASSGAIYLDDLATSDTAAPAQ